MQRRHEKLATRKRREEAKKKREEAKKRREDAMKRKEKREKRGVQKQAKLDKEAEMHVDGDEKRGRRHLRREGLDRDMR